MGQGGGRLIEMSNTWLPSLRRAPSMGRPAGPQIMAALDQGQGVGLRRGRKVGVGWGEGTRSPPTEGGWKFSGVRLRNCERPGEVRDKE